MAIGILPDASGLAQFGARRYDQARQNRAEIEGKWNDNWLAFKGLSEGKWKPSEGSKAWQSKTFINYTKQKITTAVAIFLDTVLGGGKIPFSLKPSPWEFESFDELPDELKASVEQDIDQMERRIDQQFQDTSADRQFMKHVLCGAILGETYGKKIVYDVVRRGWRKTPMLAGYDVERLPPEYVTYEPTEDVKTAPGWLYVPVWNIFRDLETDDLQAGAFVIHREMVSPGWLAAKKDRGFYFKNAISEVLREAKTYVDQQGSATSGTTAQQNSASLPPGLRKINYRQNTILYLEQWGRVPRDVCEKFEREELPLLTGNVFDEKDIPKIGDSVDDEEAGDEVEVMFAMANNKVVRYARTQSTDRPFTRAVWEQPLDDNKPISVADNAANSQIMLNGAVRAIEDCKKWTANPMVAIKSRFLDSDYAENAPGQRIEINEECDDVRKAIMPVEFPDIGNQLMELISLAQEFMDLDTMMPRIQQGADVQQPQMRAYVAQQQIERSGKYIGSCIRNYDEGLIEFFVNDFYNHNMRDPAITTGKGSFIVKAMGFASYQDKIERIAALNQFLQRGAENPEALAWMKMREILCALAKISNLDPDKAVYTVEERQSQQQQPDPVMLARAADLQASAGKKTAEAAAIPQKVAIEQAATIGKLEQDHDKNLKSEKVVE